MEGRRKNHSTESDSWSVDLGQGLRQEHVVLYDVIMCT